MKEQDDACQRKEEIALELKLTESQSDFIVAVYFKKQFHSSRCWRNVDIARENFTALESEGQQLSAVYKQILIQYLGLGWIDAHHPWSQEGKVFSSNQLLYHLISVMIPLESKLDFPDEPTINLPKKKFKNWGQNPLYSKVSLLQTKKRQTNSR